MEKLTQKERMEIKRNLAEIYPKGAEVELIKMDDPYTKIPAGTKGKVNHIDDMATIFVNWDSGSGLGVVYGEDEIKPIFNEEYMTEDDMERFLQYKGYTITSGDESLVDSTLVSDFAVDLGYDVKMNKDDINEFTLNKWCEWCGEDFEESDTVDSKIGLVCSNCERAIKSRGEDI